MTVAATDLDTPKHVIRLVVTLPYREGGDLPWRRYQDRRYDVCLVISPGEHLHLVLKHDPPIRA
jgi:hypothetical protein